MSDGPGKYNDVATQAREQADAELVVLIVINGKRGTGFEVQTRSPGLAASMPTILRDVASEIERDMKGKAG